jgi:hypothetical protein
MIRPLLAMCLMVSFTGAALAQKPPEAALEKARKTFAAASDRARKELLESFAYAEKVAINAGDLDGVKTIRSEKEAFDNGGKLPVSPRMKKAALVYQVEMKQATAALERTYELVVRELTRAGKIADAEKVQAELKDVLNKSPTVKIDRPGEVGSKADLQKFLPETTWTLDGGLTFKPDGSVVVKQWAEDGLVTKWEVVDRRTVVIIVEKGRDTNRTVVITFSEDLTEFGGFLFDGSKMSGHKRVGK